MDLQSRVFQDFTCILPRLDYAQFFEKKVFIAIFLGSILVLKCISIGYIILVPYMTCIAVYSTY